MSQVVKPWVKSAKKYVIIAACFGVLLLVLGHFGLLSKLYKKSITVAAVDLPTAPANAKTSGLKFYPLPTSTPSAIQGPIYTLELMAWNSQQGLIYANGGIQTTVGSLFEKYGIKLKIVRQDAGSQSATNLVKFATDYKANSTTATGVVFYNLMGDGWPSALAGINKTLLALDGGKGEYTAVVVTAVGKSYGEDAMLADSSWKHNPQKAKGSLVSTVLRDGDHNISLKWAADNGIPVNTDEKTYDPEAMNFVNAVDNDFIKSADRYIAGKPVTLKLVKNGKAIKDTDVYVNAVSTWSPADYNIATQKGGLVRIVSTHEYSSQMPSVTVTIRKFAQEHASYIENFIRATTDGGDQVKSFSAALDKASELSAKVYNDKTGDFWKKLDLGYTMKDKIGLQVEIGGSAQYNLADVANLFGLAPGSSNVYQAVYNTFSNIDLSLYPEIFRTTPFVPYDKAVDLTYLTAVLNDKNAPVTTATEATYTASDKIGQVVAKKSWHIEFATGSAELTPAGLETASHLYDDLVQNSLKVELDGSTDNTGSETINQTISLARANAIKTYLQTKSSTAFPENRFIIQGLGSSKPIADNSTLAGRSKNRRVDVIMATE